MSRVLGCSSPSTCRCARSISRMTCSASAFFFGARAPRAGSAQCPACPDAPRRVPPLDTMHLPCDRLRLCALPLARERACQLGRTPQRVEMLLAEKTPPQPDCPDLATKRLVNDRLRLDVLELARKRQCQIARTNQRLRMFLAGYPIELCQWWRT
jgi:hypothetical protein